MTVSSDATAGASAGPGGPSQVSQAAVGLAPPPADCFTPRPHTGPGALAALPAGECLVLTAPPPHDAARELPGSTGKTQLAAYLARTWLQENPGGLLIWLDAGSRDLLLSGYLRAAARAGAGPAQPPADAASADSAELTAGRFVAGLAQAPAPWLVVLDGLADPADAEGLWPGGPSGRVLVTAEAGVAVEPGVTVPESLRPRVFSVGPFSSHEGLTYLMARLSEDPDQRLGAVDLAEELGCDPIALVQASAAIASAGIGCRDYHDLYIKRREQIAAAGAAPAAMAVTWTLSVECADELAPGGAPQLCLALAALIGSAGIPEPVLAARAVADFAARARGGTARVGAALTSLRSAGLLDVEAGLVRVPRAVRTAVLAATPDSLRAEAAAAAAAALLEAWPDDAADPALACTLRACTASLLETAGSALWAGGVYQVLFRAGQSLDAARVTGPAYHHWGAVAAASEQWLGAAHEDTQRALASLAAAALAAGFGPEAVALYLRVLDTRGGYLGTDHPHTVAARGDFGTALLAVGQPAEAIGVLESVLAACERGGGAGPVDVLAVQDSLGTAYQAVGRHKDALRAIERTLAERERQQGADHPEAIRTRRRLARAWLDAGHPKDAIKHGNRALAGAERVLGRDSLDTIDAVTLLALAHHSARRVRDAIALYERALADRERVQGADHPDTIGVRGNLASAYHSAGRMPSALELYERTRTDCQRVLGPDHPDTLAARANLAHAYYAVGRTSDARLLLTAALADCERVLAPDDPLTVAVRDSMAAMDHA